MVSLPRESLSLPSPSKEKEKQNKRPFPRTRLLTTPIELIKIQQQKQQQHLSTPKTGRIPTARTVALHIYRTAGVPGLYRGFAATMLRDVGGFGLYFSGVGCFPFLPPLRRSQNSLALCSSLPVRRHATPLHPRPDACETHTPRRPSAGRGGQHALASLRLGTALARRWRCGDPRLAGDVPVRRSQDAHASADADAEPRRAPAGCSSANHIVVVARRAGVVRRSGRAGLLAGLGAYHRARRPGQHGRVRHVRKCRLGLLMTSCAICPEFEPPNRPSLCTVVWKVWWRGSFRSEEPTRGGTCCLYPAMIRKSRRVQWEMAVIRAVISDRLPCPLPQSRHTVYYQHYLCVFDM